MIITFTGPGHDLVVADIDHITDAEEELLLGQAAPEARPDLARQIMRLRVAERRKLAAATSAQQQIGWGGYASYTLAPGLAPAQIAQMPGARELVVYGDIYTRAQMRAYEQDAIRRLADWGQPPVRSLADSMAYADSAHTAGWRYGRWYSCIEPGGETGMMHIADLTAISGEQFRAARRDGWPQEVPG